MDNKKLIRVIASLITDDGITIKSFRTRKIYFLVSQEIVEKIKIDQYNKENFYIESLKFLELEADKILSNTYYYGKGKIQVNVEDVEIDFPIPTRYLDKLALEENANYEEIIERFSKF